MKREGHPSYKQVVFLDSSSGEKFLCATTLETEETIDHEGREYPLYRVSISSASHPFYKGQEGIVDTEGRVERFQKKYARSASEHKAQREKQKKGTTFFLKKKQ